MQRVTIHPSLYTTDRNPSNELVQFASTFASRRLNSDFSITKRARTYDLAYDAIRTSFTAL